MEGATLGIIIVLCVIALGYMFAGPLATNRKPAWDEYMRFLEQQRQERERKRNLERKRNNG